MHLHGTDGIEWSLSIDCGMRKGSTGTCVVLLRYILMRRPCYSLIYLPRLISSLVAVLGARALMCYSCTCTCGTFLNCIYPSDSICFASHQVPTHRKFRTKEPKYDIHTVCAHNMVLALI